MFYTFIRKAGSDMEAQQIRILEATADLFNEYGFKFTMQQLASKLKMSKKTLYVWFDNKRDLFHAMADYIFDAVQERKREIYEETGIVVDENRDEIFVINKLLFSSPGMTDESNGLVCVKLHLDNLDMLDQTGAVGQEFFDGFELVSEEKARELIRAGIDDKGHYYSVYTWAALMYFISGLWK